MGLERLEYYANKSNYVIGLLVMILGGMLIVFGGGSFLNVLSWLYVSFLELFGLMMISAECKIGFFQEYCGFLSHYIGRGIFNLYVASICLYFAAGGDVAGSSSSSELITIVAVIGCIVLSLCGILFIVLGMCGGRANKDQLLDKSTSDKIRGK